MKYPLFTHRKQILWEKSIFCAKEEPQLVQGKLIVDDPPSFSHQSLKRINTLQKPVHCKVLAGKLKRMARKYCTNYTGCLWMSGQVPFFLSSHKMAHFLKVSRISRDRAWPCCVWVCFAWTKYGGVRIQSNTAINSLQKFPLTLDFICSFPYQGIYTLLAGCGVWFASGCGDFPDRQFSMGAFL